MGAWFEGFGIIDKLVGLRARAYAEMLACLSDDHRRFLFALIGRWAVASAPDLRVAAQELDAHLTATEKDKIAKAALGYAQGFQEANDDLISRLLASGEKVTIGQRSGARLTFEEPALALLDFTVDELVFNLNSSKVR